VRMLRCRTRMTSRLCVMKDEVGREGLIRPASALGRSCRRTVRCENRSWRRTYTAMCRIIRITEIWFARTRLSVAARKREGRPSCESRAQRKWLENEQKHGE
jgi:hypothetical protein